MLTLLSTVLCHHRLLFSTKVIPSTVTRKKRLKISDMMILVVYVNNSQRFVK